MAEDTEKQPDSIIERARSRFEQAKDVWGDIYDKARDDLRFLSDDEYAQWDGKLSQERLAAGLNCITLDKIDQAVHQVVNSIRQNTPTINVIPDGEGGDEETAEAFKGIIKGIEYSSRADSAYDTAAENAVKARIGFIRVDHDYADDKGFEQKLCIRRVVNPLTCYIDPTSVEIDGSDAGWGFVLDEVKVSTFKEKWPNKEPVSFGAEKGATSEGCKDSDILIIAEYFEKAEERRQVAQLSDGSVVDFIHGMEAKATRWVTKTTIKRVKLSGNDVLEETSFPGRYIPIVPVYGKEAWEDGKRKLQSLISKSKAAAQLHNLWASIETDMLLRASRAPIIAPVGSTEEFIDDYRNPDKAAVLRYTPYDSNRNPLPAPQRLNPFPVPSGVVNARNETVDDIKAAMGIYNSSLGAVSNETSGIAIARRQAQGDAATFHYGDNLVKSVEHIGRILVFAIPEIYDTSRVLLSVDAEEKPKMVGVNGAMVEGQKQTIDLKKGRFTVRVTTGPSHVTRRQEAFESLKELFQAQPQMIQTFGDLFFRAGDFTGAQAMAERAEKLLPPQLKADDEQADPQMQQLAAENMQLKELLQQAQQQMENGDAELQAKMQEAKMKNQIEIIKIAQDREEAAAQNEIKRQELALKERELEIKEIELRGRLMQPETPETQSGLTA